MQTSPRAYTGTHGERANTLGGNTRCNKYAWSGNAATRPSSVFISNWVNKQRTEVSLRITGARAPWQNKARVYFA